MVKVKYRFNNIPIQNVLFRAGIWSSSEYESPDSLNKDDSDTVINLLKENKAEIIVEENR